MILTWFLKVRGEAAQKTLDKTSDSQIPNPSDSQFLINDWGGGEGGGGWPSILKYVFHIIIS